MTETKYKMSAYLDKEDLELLHQLSIRLGISKSQAVIHAIRHTANSISESPNPRVTATPIPPNLTLSTNSKVECYDSANSDSINSKLNMLEGGLDQVMTMCTEKIGELSDRQTLLEKMFDQTHTEVHQIDQKAKLTESKLNDELNQRYGEEIEKLWRKVNQLERELEQTFIPTTLNTDNLIEDIDECAIAQVDIDKDFPTPTLTFETNDRIGDNAIAQLDANKTPLNTDDLVEDVEDVAIVQSLKTEHHTPSGIEAVGTDEGLKPLDEGNKDLHQNRTETNSSGDNEPETPLIPDSTKPFQFLPRRHLVAIIKRWQDLSPTNRKAVDEYRRTHKLTDFGHMKAADLRNLITRLQIDTHG